MNEHVTNRPTDPATRITDRPATDTRIQVAPPARGMWRTALQLLGVVVAAWVVLTSQGCLPRLEGTDEPDPEAVRPVNLHGLFAQVQRSGGAAEELDAIEAGVEQLLDNVRAATGKRGIALPGSLRDAEVARVIEKAHVRGGVFIAKERVRLSHAHSCVVVCPGVVEISHGSNNVVVAGQFLKVSFDGMNLPGGVVGAPDRSVLVCIRELNIGFARDTVCVAPAGHISHSHRVTFLGRVAGTDSHRFWCKDLSGPVPYQRAATPDPLAGKVDGVAIRDEGSPRACRLHFATGAERHDLGQGDEVRAGLLAGWRVVHCCQRAAVLYNGNEWSLLRPKGPPESPRR